jgi:NOL1/NOP2/sun family putative RNA methylase
MEIPKAFMERYTGIVDDMEAFASSMCAKAPKSFRVNTIKADADEVQKRFEGYGIGVKRMRWYPDAFISENPDISSTTEHFLGHIYIQELPSMLPPLLVREELHGAFVLDCCAAPGSKTTQLAAIMQNSGILVANDIEYERIRALKFNLEKAGAVNTIITNQDLRFYPKIQFDVVLLDAPCSSEGTIRKNTRMLEGWSVKTIHRSADRQKQLIAKAFALLKPGGTMVYSTCTFAPEENEGVVNWLLERREAKLLPIDIPGLKLTPGITEWNGNEFNQEVKKTMRLWPHHNDTGGFFVAKVAK